MSVLTQISRITAAVGAAYDAVTAKGGTTPQAETVAGLADAIGTIPTGGSAPGAPGDITFYDYDGTIVTSWTLEELATKTALPDYPSHEGLTCQGWNWSLADLKTTNRKMNVGATYITDDGKTRIYIRLEEGRTSPMLGVCPNGTVTVDWGDGTTPDTLTGTSTTTVKWTPNHAYAAPGEYVIKLTVDGAIGLYGNSANNENSGLLRYSSNADRRNHVYQNTIKKVELGAGVIQFNQAAFADCHALTSITVPNSITGLPLVLFYNCYSLTSFTIPLSVKNTGTNVFGFCHSLVSVAIPNSVTAIGTSMFSNCQSLQFVTIPNSATAIYSSSFDKCYSITSLRIPSTVNRIGNMVFYNCWGIAFYDFTSHTSVPTLGTNTFYYISSDCQIRVPLSLVDDWKAATNWSNYADQIVGV